MKVRVIITTVQTIQVLTRNISLQYYPVNTHKFTEVDYCNIHTHNFIRGLKIKLQNEEEARKWVQEYNSVTQETMVFQRSKNQLGKQVCKKLYLQCHHYQRNRAMSNICLKTTHRLHNTKNCNCPAQIIITILAPHQCHQGYLLKPCYNTHIITLSM